jgi:hypothetical protein
MFRPFLKGHHQVGYINIFIESLIKHSYKYRGALPKDGPQEGVKTCRSSNVLLKYNFL